MLKLVIMLTDGSWGSVDGATIYSVSGSADADEMLSEEPGRYEIARLNDEGDGELSVSLRRPIIIKA